MSIFRETFPDFVKTEINRRQDGMFNRTPNFMHEINSRASWVRMTSGVNYQGTNKLAKQYVLQAGTLDYVKTVKDKDSRSGKRNQFSLKYGLDNAYYNKAYYSKEPNRSGIRPMPGITGVSIQSKGAYGSLQEATVTFNCWDIKQLEELELLYMRPGYTVLLEFGWDSNQVPAYDILDLENISLNDAFADIYEKIDKSGGKYDALLGYVKNYNWSARADGGYDCTTSIISLGEVLESLKCNWVPSETTAFDLSGKGLLQIPGNSYTDVLQSYEKGIIPGLLQELWNSMIGTKSGESKKVSSPVSKDPNQYFLYRLDVKEEKNNRGGLTKNLGPNSKAEIYITLGSFCDLLSTYVCPKGKSNQPLVEIVTYETDYKSSEYIVHEKVNTTNTPETAYATSPTANNFAKSLKCIASPLALSTNLGVCFVRNDNWDNLSATNPGATTPPSSVPFPPDVSIAVDEKGFGSPEFKYLDNNMWSRFAPKIKKYPAVKVLTNALNPIAAINASINPIVPEHYEYQGNLQEDISKLADDLGKSLSNVYFTTINGVLEPVYDWPSGDNFVSPSINGAYNTVNLLNYFVKGANNLYDDLFNYNYDPAPPGKLVKGPGSTVLVEDPFDDAGPVKDNTGISWDKAKVVNALEKALSNVPLNTTLQQISQNQTQNVISQIAQVASSNPNALQFLEDNNGDTKQLGYISNIYVNLNYLYEQAVSKNTASNDPQNKNTISIRDYIQGILRDVQNSLGNVNTFDIQVDNRNAIGRIIDIAYTGTPGADLCKIEIQNTKSVVRDYKFSSKIFPEMGSIIAISAQDSTGIGKLGYDNSTLVAWNEGIKDRLIPKKDFNSDIALSNGTSPTSFLFPFLTKIYSYFQYINGKVTTTDTFNYAYGGLDFAYRDFLANLDRFDPQNRFKTIIPTELTITLDGIGGIIIGNLFKINQDIVPKGYRNTGGRDLAYIVTRLGHEISENDWTTTLGAYPVVFENKKSTQVISQWSSQKYPGTVITAGKIKIRIKNPAAAAANELVIFNTLKAAGWNKVQVAAALGNMSKETGGTFDPYITFAVDLNGYPSVGLIQWNGRGVGNTKDPNGVLDIIGTTVEDQTNYLINKWPNTARFLKATPSSTTPYTAGFNFAKIVEVCADCGNLKDYQNSKYNPYERSTFAEEYYNRFNTSGDPLYWQ